MTSLRLTLLAERTVPEEGVRQAAALLPAAIREDITGAGWHAVRLTAQVPAGGVPDADLRRLRTQLRTRDIDLALVTGPLVHAPPGLVVTDVDSTLITEEVIELLADHAGAREQVAEVTDRAMRGELDFAASLAERVATLAGLPVTVLQEVRDAVRLTPGADALVAAVRAAGGRFGVVSGGFAEVVEPIARQLGVDHMLANRLEVTDGRLTGRTLGPVVDGAAKEQALRSWAQVDGVPLDRCVAVGDGANDLRMLHAAGLGVAYCAKPVVWDQAQAAVSVPRLDAVLALTAVPLRG